MGIFEVDIVHVRTECFFDYLKMIPKGIEIMKKHGGNPVNQFMVEAGGAPEVIFFNKYDSMEQRSKCIDCMMKDPEFHEFFKQGAKAILRVQNYVCVPNPEIGTNPPKNPNSKKVLEMIKVCDPTQVGQKMKDLVCFWQEKMGDKAFHLLGLLHPILFTQQCVLAVFECPDNIDASLKIYGETLADAKNWPKIQEAHKQFDVQSMRLLKPLSSIQMP